MRRWRSVDKQGHWRIRQMSSLWKGLPTPAMRAWLRWPRRRKPSGVPSKWSLRV
jgi:hypothetical protein